jgi:hypothetical protein
VAPVSRAGRAIARTAGASWRGLWWVACPPVGWLMSRSARERRRHNATIRAISQSHAHAAPAARPVVHQVFVPATPVPYRRRVIEPEYGRPPVPPPPPWWGTPAPTGRP